MPYTFHSILILSFAVATSGATMIPHQGDRISSGPANGKLTLLAQGAASPQDDTRPTEPEAEKKKHRVLVIPFDDAPNENGSGAVFTAAFVDMFSANISKDRYALIEIALLKDMLVKMQKAVKDLTSTDLQSDIAEQLGADLIITGKVTVWKKGNLFKQPTVGFDARCRSAEDGTLVWTLSHVDEAFFAKNKRRTPENAAPVVCEKALKKSDIPGKVERGKAQKRKR